MRLILAIVLLVAALAGCGSSTPASAPQPHKVSAIRIAQLSIAAHPETCAAILAGVESLPYAEAVADFAAGYRPAREANPALPSAGSVFAATLLQCRRG